MAKELVVYKKKIKKANMASKSKGIAKGDIWKKASREQRFLGKTFPRVIGGAAKWLWRHPLTATAAWLVGERMLKKRPGFKYPEHRQFDKRGRKYF